MTKFPNFAYHGYVTLPSGSQQSVRGSVADIYDGRFVMFNNMDALLTPVDAKLLGQALVVWAEERLAKRQDDVLVRMDELLARWS